MSDENNNTSTTSNPPTTTETGKTETQTDMPGKEFLISHVQDSGDKVRSPRLRG